MGGARLFDIADIEHGFRGQKLRHLEMPFFFGIVALGQAGGLTIAQ